MKEKIDSIQGLRGLSILAVFFSHWFAGASSAGFLPERWVQELSLLNLGKYGVELFFMISGFVITKSLARHGDVVSFCIDRIARIYPLFIALHFFIFISGPLIHNKFFLGVDAMEWSLLFVTNMLFLPGVFDLPIAQLAAWSLSYEVLFYVLAAFAYQNNKSGAGLVRLCVVVACATGFAWFHPRALFFLPGVIAYFVIESRRFHWHFPGVAGAVALVGFFALWSAIAPEDGKTLPQAVFRSTADALSFAAALWCATFFFFQVLYDDGWLKRFMSSRWLVAMGEVSYSFYLLHVVVMFPLKRLTATFVLPLAGDLVTFVVFGVAAFLATYFLSILSRQLLEVRAGTWVKGLLSRLQNRAATTHHA